MLKGLGMNTIKHTDRRSCFTCQSSQVTGAKCSNLPLGVGAKYVMFLAFCNLSLVNISPPKTTPYLSKLSVFPVIGILKILQHFKFQLNFDGYHEQMQHFFLYKKESESANDNRKDTEIQIRYEKM